MPVSAPHPCNHPGCGVLTRDRYCLKHQAQSRKEDQQRRGTAAQRGYGPRWRKAREAYLFEHPICVECQKEGIVTPATVVDHIISHKGDQRLFWDRNNWQALCKPHHDQKTAREDGGFGRYGNSND